MSFRSNHDCLVLGWDSGVKKMFFLSVSGLLHDISLTIPRKLNITTACLKFEE